jgi:hypothetical protein
MKETQIEQEIMDYLALYTVDLPNEEEVDCSIEYILSQVPIKERKLSIVKRNAKIIITNSLRELMVFGWVFWSFNSLFLLLGLLSLVTFNHNPYITQFVLAPLPFMIGIFEILKSRNVGLVELELTLKFNAQQILASRLFIVGLYNLFINVSVSILCLQLYQDIIFTKLLLSWTVPYVLVTSIAFLAALYIKSNLASSMLLTIWFAVCYGMVQVEEIQQWLSDLNGLKALGMILIGALLWTMHIQRIKNMKLGSEGI